MNDPSHRMNLNQRTEQDLETTHQSRSESTATEFQTAEELLRHDAATLEIPESIAGRLAESAHRSPAESWWRRMFRS